MSLTPELVRWLQSDEAQPWLQTLTANPPSEAALLGALTRLRAHLSPERASALITTAQSRRDAVKKFGDMAEKMFFSEKALQQATPYPVASYTARRYKNFEWVADLGCGLGGDSLALSSIGVAVLAVDRDPLAVALASANARALGLTENIHPVQGDILYPAWRISAAWADPGRRTAGRRIFHPEALQPPLSAILKLQRTHAPHLGVKLMPGLAHEHIPPETEAEWISLSGELKEVVLWFGALKEKSGRRATVLPAGKSLWADGSRAPVRAPGAFLFEPDPAVIRAGAVGDLAQSLNLWQIDSEIAYLSGDALVQTHFARSWRILEHFAFDLKALNRRLRALKAQVTAVKKRASPIEPESFRKRLHKTPGGRAVIVVLTRVNDRPWMLICEKSNAFTHSQEIS